MYELLLLLLVLASLSTASFSIFSSSSTASFSTSSYFVTYRPIVIFMFSILLTYRTCRGGYLGDWGTVPPKFEVGGRPMHWSPQVFREVVLSDARESMNRVKKVFF